MTTETHTQPAGAEPRETDDPVGGERLPSPPRARGEREVALGAMTVTTVRIYPELAAQMKAYCTYTGETQNTVFNEAVRAFLSQHRREIVRGFQIKEMVHDAERRMVEESLDGSAGDGTEEGQG